MAQKNILRRNFRTLLISNHKKDTITWKKVGNGTVPKGAIVGGVMKNGNKLYFAIAIVSTTKYIGSLMENNWCAHYVVWMKNNSKTVRCAQEYVVLSIWSDGKTSHLFVHFLKLLTTS